MSNSNVCESRKERHQLEEVILKIKWKKSCPPDTSHIQYDCKIQKYRQVYSTARSSDECESELFLSSGL